ncbi:4'-phosphopantetheinyl transferase superfamily protein [Halodesulfurarchaeum sp. HSR-GB]|uniref:holo-ACP synthase n=1 Tax=Halodesulfurarchaeum sp. HSR-GB TaxID=3074077 RepID=UPI0028570FEC|nr:4'-phosphopantetheinyl transferase superfamily protein [Halodesulfurarchaeum sp. HSR-GB]MDR5657590.1 4'-phosphopantetheinyl transferase superfamily protein [Halodesulfurarchaeum sp. HSR-GB]
MRMRGVGVDVVCLGHLETVFTDTFRDAVFSDREIAYAEASGWPLAHYATTFAGKEAVKKAIDSDLPVGPAIEIRRDAIGKPTVSLTGDRTGLDGSRILLSLAFDGDYAVGFALCW